MDAVTHKSVNDSSRKIRLLRILAGLAVIAALLLAAVYWTRSHSQSPVGKAKRLAATQRRVVPAAELPPVEPVEFVAELPADEARRINEKVSFVIGGVVPASPFRLAGTELDRQRAIGCLAVAVLYEAGDDATGERAVAQVVLNRVRHPAFPKTVCGVVFQGSERTTGCQFTFTCDGALNRIPNPEALARATAIATKALEGAVEKGVGHATHYHTDWVVPYWSSSLDKIARVKTHLFFRWTGWWGTRPAFRGNYAGNEPVIAKIGPLFETHRPVVEPAVAATVVPEAAAQVAGRPVEVAIDESSLAFRPTSTNPDFFLVTIPKSLSPKRYVAVAERACGARARCVFMAWVDPGLTPAGLPATTSQLQSVAFHYLRDPALAASRARWNCQLTPFEDKSQCLSHQGG